VIAAAGVGAASTALVTDPESGPARSLRFWAGAVPVYARYKWVEYDTRPRPAPPAAAAAEGLHVEALQRQIDANAEEDRARRYKELHKRYAPEVEALTLKLKGLFVGPLCEFLPRTLCRNRPACDLRVTDNHMLASSPASQSLYLSSSCRTRHASQDST
jgi:hypothetical protein